MHSDMQHGQQHSNARRWHAVVLTAVLMLGCSSLQPADADADADGWHTEDFGADLEETSDTVCDPEACAAKCAYEYSECFEPLTGACAADGVCECSPTAPCPPCIEEVCEPFGVCTSDNGICSFCYTRLPISTEPPDACTISLVGYPFPEYLLPYAGVWDGGNPLERLDSCVDAVEGELAWGLTPNNDAAVLCEEACLALLRGAPFEFIVGCPPG